MTRKHLPKFICSAVEFGLFDIFASLVITFYIFGYFAKELSESVLLLCMCVACFGAAVAKTALFIWQTIRFFKSGGDKYPAMTQIYIGLLSAAAMFLITFLTFRFSDWLMFGFAAACFLAEIIMTLVTYKHYKDTFTEPGAIYTGNRD